MSLKVETSKQCEAIESFTYHDLGSGVELLESRVTPFRAAYRAFTTSGVSMQARCVMGTYFPTVLEASPPSKILSLRSAEAL
jgi:hypothetical protein